MSKKKNKIQHRTMPTHNLIDRNISMFATKQEAQPNNEGWGWTRRLIPHYAPSASGPIYTISMMTRRKLKASTSRIFDYAVSVAAAKIQEDYRIQRSQAEDRSSLPPRINYEQSLVIEPGNDDSLHYTVEFDLKDYLRECQMDEHSENITRAANDLMLLIGSEVSMIGDDGSNHSFAMLSHASKVKGSTVIRVGIAKSMLKVMDEMEKKRFKNLSKALPIESLKTREFWKFLQQEQED